MSSSSCTKPKPVDGPTSRPSKKQCTYTCGTFFQNPDRKGSTHYGIGYDGEIAQYVDEGINYPTALSKALKTITNSTVDTPNDLLGLSYIREIIKNNYNLDKEKYRFTTNIPILDAYPDIKEKLSFTEKDNIKQRLFCYKELKNHLVVRKASKGALTNRALELSFEKLNKLSYVLSCGITIQKTTIPNDL